MGVLGITGNAKTGNQFSDFGRYDVKRASYWIMQFASTFGTDQFRHSLSIALSTASRPTLGVGTVEMHHGSEKWYVAGKQSVETSLSCKMYDALPTIGVNYDFQRDGVESPHPDGNGGQISAGQLMYNWFLLMYNPSTGNVGLASEYQTDAFITLFANNETPIERWMYLGIFPTSIGMGDLDWSDEASGLTVDVTFQFSKVYRIAPDTKTEPVDASEQLQPEPGFFSPN